LAPTPRSFSILNSLLLKPLPVRDPQTLVALASNRVGEDAAMTYPVWRDIRDRRVLNDSFVWATDRVTSVVGGNSQSLETIWASGPFLRCPRLVDECRTRAQRG
jgi:hypothetical protein